MFKKSTINLIRIFIVVLLFISLFSGIQTGFLNKVDAASSIVVDDNFNNDVTGNEPIGWTSNTSGGPISIEEVPSSSDKSVKIEDQTTPISTDPTSKKSTGITKTFPAQSGKFVIEMDVMAAQINQRINALYIKNGTTEAVKVIIAKKGNIKYFNSGAGIIAQTYEANKWYKIKVQLDTNTDKYDLYIDGNQIATKVSFTNPVTEVDTIDCTIGPDYTGIINVDNVRVSNIGTGDVVNIIDINPVEVTTEEGIAPELPAKVTAIYIDETAAQVDVVWNAIESSQYKTVGNFTVEGTVDGTDIKAIAEVTVVEKLEPVNIAPVDPNALQISKDLMDYLVGLKYETNNKVLLGQTVAIKMESFETDYNGLNESTGKYPAFIQPWTGNWWSSKSYGNIDLTNVIPQIVNSYNRGSIPMLLLNPHNPWNGLGYGEDKKTKIFVPDGHTLDEIYDESTDAYKAYHEELDIVAEGISMLQDKGIPVVLRMFGECNYGTHWYHLNQEDMSNEEFKELWTHTVEYLTDTKGLHNVLFCYEIADKKANRMGGLVVDKTDIMAIQTHEDGKTYNSYTEYKALTDKPIIIGQYLRKDEPDYDNMDMINTIKDYNPDIVAVLYWSNGCNITSKQNEDLLVADDWIATADETPYAKTPLPTDLPYTSSLLPYIDQLGKHSYDFNVNNDMEGWTTWDNERIKVDVSNFYSIRFNSYGTPAYEAYIESPRNMNMVASKIDNFRIRMKNFSQATKLKLQWTTNKDTNWDDNKSIEIDISKGDMEFKEYTYKLSQNPNWNGTIKQVRLYPVYDSWMGACNIDYISFLDDETFNSIPQPETIKDPHQLNIAYGKTAYTNDYTTRYFTPDLAVDADPHTRFSKGVKGVNTTPLWWKVDLGNVYNINNINLLLEYNFDNQYTISVSNDDVNYTEVVDHSTDIGLEGLLMHSVDIAARYVKVQLINGSTIYECDIRGNLDKTNIMNYDLNEDGENGVSDLAVIAGYYNKTNEDSLWEQAKVADLKGDNIINSKDFKELARKVFDVLVDDFTEIMNGNTEEQSYSPIDDAYVNLNNVGKNFGAKPQINLANEIKKGYIKFDITQSEPIEKATLRLFGKAGNNTIPLNIYGVLKDDWNETTITAANAPERQETEIATINIDPIEKWYEVDITDFVVDQKVIDSKISLALEISDSPGEICWFYSKETTNKNPQLVITHPEPIVTTLVIPDHVTLGEEFRANLGLTGVADSQYGDIYAGDITIQFNEEELEFVDVEGKDGLDVAVNTTTPGSVRLLFIVEGESNTIKVDTDMLDLTFKAKRIIDSSKIMVEPVILANDSIEFKAISFEKSIDITHNKQDYEDEDEDDEGEDDEDDEDDEE